jgi:prepilin peptidase CpaA
VPELSLDNVLLIVCMSVYTAAAAVTDVRLRKIPNKLTLPVFFAGFVYQLAFHQWGGLVDAAAGFALGFGILFVLWMIGGGGGGDVKLMGALSVWLGFRLTLMVLALSTAFVLFGTLGVMLWSMLTRGVYKTKEQYMDSGDAEKTRRPKHHDRDAKQRRIMAYAVPVALATWIVLIVLVPKWPQRLLPAHGAADPVVNSSISGTTVN